MFLCRFSDCTVCCVESKFEIKILVSSCRVKDEFDVSRDTSSLQYLFDEMLICKNRESLSKHLNVRIEGIP